MDQKTKEKIFRDYVVKINEKNYESISSRDINNLIVFLNWCFHTKNNFFVEAFNKNLVHSITAFYNQVKTNILLLDSDTIFDKIEISKIKNITNYCGTVIMELVVFLV